MSIGPLRIARALAITKPIPYTANGVWEATVQNVADALDLPLNSLSRNSFLKNAGVEIPDLLDELITENEYSPEGYK